MKYVSTSYYYGNEYLYVYIYTHTHISSIYIYICESETRPRNRPFDRPGPRVGVHASKLRDGELSAEVHRREIEKKEYEKKFNS